MEGIFGILDIEFVSTHIQVLIAIDAISRCHTLRLREYFVFPHQFASFLYISFYVIGLNTFVRVLFAYIGNTAEQKAYLVNFY